MIEIVLIVAVAENGVIGAGGTIPWRLKTDQQRLKAITLNKPVVMGRKTFESLRRPLPGRTNIVVTRDPNFSGPGVLVAPSVENALAIAAGDALRRGVDEIVVAGGAEIYAQTLARAERIALTLVHIHSEGDTKFPILDREFWEEVKRVEHAPGPEDEAPFALVDYRRRSSGKATESRP